MSVAWAAVFAVVFAVGYLVIATVASAHFSGSSGYSAFVVPGWVLGVVAAVALLGFVLGVTGKLPGTR